MSIVLLARSLNIGGAQRQLVELAKGLHKRGMHVSVVLFYDGGALLREVEAAGVRVRTLGKRGRWDVLGFLGRMVRALRHERPQVIYAFLVEPSILATLVKPFLPRTRVVWGVRASNMAFTEYGFMWRVTFLLSRWLARFASSIVANSWAGATYHGVQGYPLSKLAVIPNGVDVVRFSPNAQAGREARAAWGIGETRIVVGIVGRLDRMKDHPTFLEAAALLAAVRSDLMFVCVGDGPPHYRAELQARALSLGLADHVVWTGFVENMTAVYNALDVLCLSSAFGEGFSNALAEAMACGIPCVATAVGDAERILEGCGIIVPPEDPRRLAEAVQETLRIASSDRRRAARERILREFTVEKMVEDTERLLGACVDAA